MKTQGRTGRPRLGEGEGKRHTLGLRVTEQRKRQLEEAARASGRSLSAELEIRLEQSFWTEEILGGRELLAVFQRMAAAVLLAQVGLPRRADKTWLTDIKTYMEIRKAWIAILDDLAPLAPEEAIQLIRSPANTDDLIRKIAERRRTRHAKPSRSRHYRKAKS